MTCGKTEGNEAIEGHYHHAPPSLRCSLVNTQGPPTAGMFLPMRGSFFRPISEEYQVPSCNQLSLTEDILQKMRRS